MRIKFFFLTAAMVLLFLAEACFAQTNILVVTGGKDFERDSFFEIFRSYIDVEFDTASKPSVYALFNFDRTEDYDAIVFYDTYQPISEDEKISFLSLFEKGIGVVFLHHAIVSHQEWDEYEKIIGGKYHHKPYMDEGKKYGPSTYKHDQDFLIKIIDREHPVTKGINDFKIIDEAYINYKVHDYVTPLLTSDNCENGRNLGWTNIYKNSKIVYLQLGHDHQAYENPYFRLLIRNSIEWVRK